MNHGRDIRRMIRSQAPPAKTRGEVLRDEYVQGDSWTLEQYEYCVEHLLTLDALDDPCPYSPGVGFTWWSRLAVRSKDAGLPFLTPRP